jgi:hypothetical protein
VDTDTPRLDLRRLSGIHDVEGSVRFDCDDPWVVSLTVEATFRDDRRKAADRTAVQASNACTVI